MDLDDDDNTEEMNHIVIVISRESVILAKMTVIPADRDGKESLSSVILTWRACRDPGHKSPVPPRENHESSASRNEPSPFDAKTLTWG